MLLQMEEFLVTYRNSLGIQATPDCLLPADAPVIKHLLDAIIRSPSMVGCLKHVQVYVLLWTHCSRRGPKKSAQFVWKCWSYFACHHKTV